MGGAWGSPTDIEPPEAGLHQDETLMPRCGDNLLSPYQPSLPGSCDSRTLHFRQPGGLQNSNPRSKGATNLQSHYDPGSAHKSS